MPFLFQAEPRSVQSERWRSVQNELDSLRVYPHGETRSSTISTFSAEELELATNNYDHRRLIGEDAFYRLYKGRLNYDLPVCVKRYKTTHFVAPQTHQRLESYMAKDIAVGSAMGSHRNVLKLLGCCLDDDHSDNPGLLVYEHVGTTATLSDRLLSCGRNHDPLPLTCWKTRLQVALGLASAISDLHTAFRRPVVHRNIKASNIILDEADVPKLLDFSLCITIPEGQTHVEDCVVGTKGYCAPEYMLTGLVSEKVDVYDFGVVLCQLLTGETCSSSLVVRDGKAYCCRLVDERLVLQGTQQHEQVMKFSQLSLMCLSNEQNDRPSMMQVAQELQQIYQST